MIDPSQALRTELNAMDFPEIEPEQLVNPPTFLRDELFEKVFPPHKVDAFLSRLPNANSQALVVADCEGVIEWVSPAFTRMCGYSLSELRGNKAGKMLQGAETNPDSVDMLRLGIREHRTVEVQIVNYHKSGQRYDVQIELSPTHDDQGACNGYIAVEHEIQG